GAQNKAIGGLTNQRRRRRQRRHVVQHERRAGLHAQGKRIEWLQIHNLWEERPAIRRPAIWRPALRRRGVWRGVVRWRLIRRLSIARRLQRGVVARLVCKRGRERGRHARIMSY